MSACVGVRTVVSGRVHACHVRQRIMPSVSCLVSTGPSPLGCLHELAARGAITVLSLPAAAHRGRVVAMHALPWCATSPMPMQALLGTQDQARGHVGVYSAVPQPSHARCGHDHRRGRCSGACLQLCRRGQHGRGRCHHCGLALLGQLDPRFVPLFVTRRRLYGSCTRACQACPQRQGRKAPCRRPRWEAGAGTGKRADMKKGRARP